MNSIHVRREECELDLLRRMPEHSAIKRRPQGLEKPGDKMLAKRRYLVYASLFLMNTANYADRTNLSVAELAFRHDGRAGHGEDDCGDYPGRSAVYRYRRIFVDALPLIRAGLSGQRGLVMPSSARQLHQRAIGRPGAQDRPSPGCQRRRLRRVAYRAGLDRNAWHQRILASLRSLPALADPFAQLIGVDSCLQLGFICPLGSQRRPFQRWLRRGPHVDHGFVDA